MVVTDIPAGTRLGKYRVTGRLGKGGMGVVYAGLDSRLGRRVAIKLLSANDSRGDDFLQRFLLEARATAHLNHPNVVTIHDVGQRDGTYYLVMELVDGGSAQARLSAAGAYPWPEATRITADVCRGLGAAHAAGLIHRDVKPSNILLAADGTAKLADFGSTKAPTLTRGSFTQLGTVIGTPHYMSPEHCSGELLDERTDLYSLGVTYYALLVGRPPFDGHDPGLILYAHCSAPIPDPRAAVPGLPEGCARVIARAMAKVRADRYGSAGEMLGDLLALAAAASAAPEPSVRAEPMTVGIRPAPPPAPTRAPSPPGQMPEPATVDIRRGARPVAGSTTLGPRRRLVLAAGGLAAALVVGMFLTGFAFFSARSAPSAGAADRKGSSTAGQPAHGLPLQLRPRPPLLQAHKGDVTAVSIAGGRLASAGADSFVRVWDLATGAALHVMHHPTPLQTVALSADGKVAAAGSKFDLVYLWDAVSGQGLGTLSGIPAPIRGLAFAPSGKQLAVASETDLQLGDYEPPARFSGRVRLLQKEYIVSAVAFARDGKRLVACTDAGTVHLWGLPGREHRSAPGEYPGRLTAVAISGDGRRVAFGTHHGMVHLWEPNSGRPPATWTERGGKVSALALAPDHGTLVFGGEFAGPLRLCDLATGKTTRVPTGVQVVNGLCFDPDGRVLAAAGSDGSVRLWDVTLEAPP